LPGITEGIGATEVAEWWWVWVAVLARLEVTDAKLEPAPEVADDKLEATLEVADDKVEAMPDVMEGI